MYKISPPRCSLQIVKTEHNIGLTFKPSKLYQHFVKKNGSLILVSYIYIVYVDFKILIAMQSQFKSSKYKGRT